ncbi:UV radiation resistance protein and autophagy-related subunit 14-domain-containing protein [Geopyxis carbonaria]|nr:UV radiation resistance protein and autophagy-related subunit 14-domain-containing protein [Geopyxis carbonaria]
MQCAICERYAQKMSCVECAQNGLWQLRMKYLFESSGKDSAAEKVQEYIESPAGLLCARATPKTAIQNRIQDVKVTTARLKLLLQTDKDRLVAARVEAAVRKTRLDELREFARRQEPIAESTQRDIRRQNHKWKALYNRTAEARSFLCREAAGLYGLRIKRKKSGRVDYLIGGVPIPNLLNDLNAQTFAITNTSIESLSRLLVLVSHYCGLKLPNEIILPGNGNPLTSIRGPLYNRHFATRPLHVESAFSTLSRDNPTTYGKYIEGVSMLAMDIAWLCFSQGLEVNNVDDACNIGQNMWRLLIAKDSTAMNTTTFGRTSHATANGNLATALGQSIMGGFTLGYMAIVDRIRCTLQAETIVADWDLVPEAEIGAEPPDKSTISLDLNRNDITGGRQDSTDTGSNIGQWTRIRSLDQRINK